MTTLKLDTLSDRIKAHKNALVHIVKPPVCTERAPALYRDVSTTSR
ncbi:putative formate acetyltransferase 3 (pyruvate formate lyase 3) [Escherichia coli]|uniref:Putative formate acetyltransferase 3 (Pyruvate formate lyase 3) n=1 Tax=Escherichia coli TaxID=562 RepID=A0A447XZV3_ECOLX|nr:putative formate acetyltransferase 3 (pyruvate formate lyase 3) [Escherichia coli]